ncbi:MAG: hypothetical protein ABIQ16_09135 [Polyangiaceae bacterium]
MKFGKPMDGLWGAAFGLSVACGGNAASTAATAGSAGKVAADQPGAGTGGVGLGDLPAAGAAGESGNGPAQPDYVPAHDVPFDQAYFEDGSFEMNQGFGFDTCFTRTPGSVTQASNGSEGESFVRFNSGPCTGTCNPGNPSDSQIYLWFNAQPSSAMGLYFDVLNFSAEPPIGALTLAAVDHLCVSVGQSAQAALSELALAPTWQTRCIDLPALNADEWLGITVSGASFQIGLDALRLGPPCR